jgi:uncharacterized membrane protein
MIHCDMAEVVYGPGFGVRISLLPGIYLLMNNTIVNYSNLRHNFYYVSNTCLNIKKPLISPT